MGCLNSQSKSEGANKIQLKEQKYIENDKNLTLPKTTIVQETKQPKIEQTKQTKNQINKTNAEFNEEKVKSQTKTKNQQNLQIDKILLDTPKCILDKINRNTLQKKNQDTNNSEETKLNTIESIQSVKENNTKNNTKKQIINNKPVPLSLIPQMQEMLSGIKFDEGRTSVIVSRISAIYKQQLGSSNKKIETMTDNLKSFERKKSNLKYENSKPTEESIKNDQIPKDIAKPSSKKGIKIIKKQQTKLSLKKSNSKIYAYSVDDENKQRLINHKLKFKKFLDNYDSYLKDKNKKIYGLVQFFKIPHKQLALHFLLENITNLKSREEKYIFLKIRQNLELVIKYFLVEHQKHLANNDILFMNEKPVDKEPENMWINSVFNIKNSSLGIYDSKYQYWKEVITSIDEFFLHY